MREYKKFYYSMRVVKNKTLDMLNSKHEKNGMKYPQMYSCNIPGRFQPLMVQKNKCAMIKDLFCSSVILSNGHKLP